MNPLTLHEILRQPQSWQQAVAVAGAVTPPDADLWLFTGCGTSYYLSIAAARFFQEITGRTARAVPASELILSGSAFLPKGGRAVLVGFSRSGETTETVVALRRHREQGHGPVIAITCREGSELGALGDLTLALPAADDRSVVMTSSFSTMLLSALLLAARLAGDGALLSELQRLPKALADQLETLRAKGEELGRDLAYGQFIFLGLGPFYGLACEGMLKLKEMTQVPCEAYSPLEFRHGPISVAGPGTLTVLIGSGRARAQEQDVLADVRRLGSAVFEAGVALAPGRSEPAAALLSMPLLQTLGYYRAMALGKDPDRPQHLTRVVTLDPSTLG